MRFTFPREKWISHLQTGDPDQTPHSVASDLDLHCLPVTLSQVSRLQWVNYHPFHHLNMAKIMLKGILNTKSSSSSLNCFIVHVLQKDCCIVSYVTYLTVVTKCGMHTTEELVVVYKAFLKLPKI